MPPNKQYRMTHNIATGEIEYVELDDAWLLANRPDSLRLSLNKEAITADGIDEATLTMQLINPLGKNKRQRFEVTILIDDIEIIFTSNKNGKATEEITTVEVGRFEIQAVNMPSNVVILEGI